jgi:hypothetical protein
MLDVGSSFYPSTSEEGRSFDLISMGIGSELDIGCSGMDLKNAISKYFKIDYKNIMDYLKASAMEQAINYLIFENPTLFSLLNSLNDKANFGMTQSFKHCSILRNESDKKRRASNYYADALALCVAGGNTETQCVDDGKIESYRMAAVNQRRDRLNSGGGRTEGGAETSMNDFLVSEYNLPKESKVDINKFFSNIKISGDGVSSTPPTSSLPSEQDKAIKANTEALTKVCNQVRTDPAGAKKSPEYISMNSRPGVEPVLVETCGQINKYPPVERRGAISLLARQQALGEVSARVRRSMQELLTALNSPKGTTETSLLERREQREQLQDMKLQLDLLETEYSWLDKQRAAQAALIDNAPAPPPVLR